MSNHKGDPKTMAQGIIEATEETELRGQTAGGTKATRTEAQ